MERADGPAFRMVGFSSPEELRRDLQKYPQTDVVCHPGDLATLGVALPGVALVDKAAVMSSGGPLRGTVWVAIGGMRP